MGVYGRITESVNQAYRPRLHQEEFQIIPNEFGEITSFKK